MTKFVCFLALKLQQFSFFRHSISTGISTAQQPTYYFEQ